MSWGIKSFQTSRGRYPVNDFIKSQDRDTGSKITRAVSLLENYGPFLKPPDIKKITGKIYELRITGSVSVRIFYTPFQGKYYLLHAFKKESQKTPKNEIKTAIDRARELL